MTKHLITFAVCVEDLSLSEVARIADEMRLTCELNVLSVLERHNATSDQIDEIREKVQFFVAVAEQFETVA